jgi:tRNA (guanine37-N1)-methyltransferase
MRFDVITLFPRMFQAVSEEGVVGRAISQGRVHLQTWNPRDYTADKHRTVDDRPFGGGPGMVMKLEPLALAISAAKNAAQGASKVIYLSPQGQRLDQRKIEALARSEERLILLAGRYEGIDERVIETYVDEELSIGDYVLSGGELPSMVLIDALTRLLPGVLGHDESAQQDSFTGGLLDCPHYTRPESSEIGQAPAVLLSGNHEAIAQWRQQQALGRTWLRRPDLFEKLELTPEQQRLFQAFVDGLNKQE